MLTPNQAHESRWFLHVPFGVLLVAPFFLALMSGFELHDAVDLAGMMAVGPAASLAFVVAIRRFAHVTQATPPRATAATISIPRGPVRVQSSR